VVSPPEDADVRLLSDDVRAELRGLSPDNADRVGRHLVAAAQLLDDDPMSALEHARAARRTAGRLAVVREAVGLAAYLSGQWQEALTELRAVRRMTGDSTHLPLLADCERGLGRPERALALARSPEAAGLGASERVELRIVEAGARRDLGQMEAALLVLEDAGLEPGTEQEWTVRLWYTYADTLSSAGRLVEARHWFEAVVAADDTMTDASDRLTELDE
jgi:tetratricopeptide (TPR) repeat protein